jgi:hypothetical protein
VGVGRLEEEGCFDILDAIIYINELYLNSSKRGTLSEIGIGRGSADFR